MYQGYHIIGNSRTNEYLPVSKVATQAKLTSKKPPRLFKTRRDAQAALTWWLKGLVCRDDNYELIAIPVTDRENVEIIAVTLEISIKRFIAEVIYNSLEYI